MEKEEVLKKAKSECNNEYDEKVNYEALKKSSYFMVGLCAFFYIMRVIHAEINGLDSVIVSEFIVIPQGYSAFTQLFLYKKRKDKKNLYQGITLTVTCTVFLMLFLKGLFLR